MFIKLHVESLCNDKSYLGKKPARELARGLSLIEQCAKKKRWF